jgi:DNA helicase HerA-like ATPase
MTTSDDARAAADEAAKAAADAAKAAEEARVRAEELAKAAAEAEKSAEAEPASGGGETPTASTTPPQTGGASTPGGAGESEIVATVKAGYSFDGAALQIGALVDGEPVPDAQVRIPLAMLNRHGLVAGATGTGKTKTLQVLAEQVAALGVPVFAADIKGDLSGIATPGQPNDKLLARTKSIGQDWQPVGTATEYFTLGGLGAGVPIRASVDSFGPLLLAKVLGLNETQSSSLSLVFHYAKEKKLPLVDLGDLRSVLTYLTGIGKAELKELGGLSAATAGVILRELISFADEGADVFFGQPEINTSDFLRTTADGKGIVSLLELPSVQDKPALFSTFLMYLLSDLFRKLPEVGDADKPKLVFFFDEAHLLFEDASKDFQEMIEQTVRLIRSKGVGVFFVTQTPKDVPTDVLAQLGSRIQHQLRAHTPDAAKALKSTVSTYPNSGYDLEEVLTQLAIGEAIVTVMNEKGAPSPVAWTRVRAPQGSMDPTPADQISAAVKASPLLAKYGTAANPESAAETLGAKEAKAKKAAAAEVAAKERAKQEAAAEKEAERKARSRWGGSTRSRAQSPLQKAAGEAARVAARELIKSIFARRR